MRNLASDNNSGVDPLILQALASANQGYAQGYGADPWTEKMQQAFCAAFGPQARAYPVLTGTGANVLALSALLRPWEAVLCARSAHLYVDECGAPERLLGNKLIPVEAPLGKLSVAALRPELQPIHDEHRVQPRVISITQPTELGTLYSASEIRELADFAHAHDMYLHVDGARIANAVVALETSFQELFTNTGVDLLSFGGTKNGLMCGEAVVFLRPGLDRHFRFLRKQGMQLLSKMRYLSVQLEAYLSQKVWERNARHANGMARYLGEAVADLPGLSLAAPVETNAVFIHLPPELIAPLQEQMYFYVWDPQTSVVRWMTSFDTERADLDGFVATLKQLLQRKT
ncbi:MAG: threonine aldolase family protein [Candidatus Sericytochromatia bacterium]